MTFCSKFSVWLVDGTSGQVVMGFTDPGPQELGVEGEWDDILIALVAKWYL